jgi:phage protein D
LAGFPGDPLNFSASELDSLILGNADALRYKPARGVIEITGRDLTAEMLDAKTSETFANRKASDIAAAIAGRHGLGAVVDDTGGLDGTYYEIDHRRLNNAASEWDLLCELADLYNFTVKVRGQTLFFQRAGSAAGGNYVIEWIAPGGAVGYPVSNAIELEFTRNSMLGQKAVKVSVGSFNAKQKTRFLDSATANRAKASGNGVLEYSYNVPGLTADQCKAVAAARLGGIMRNEMVLCAVLPGDALLDADMIVTVVGTGTAFDQDYYAMSVNRRMSAEEGYVMRLEAKNHAPETEVDD